MLSRLAWPSGMVRERACVAIADLLFDSRCAEITKRRLINWIRTQSLESILSIGLIIFLYNKTAHADYMLPSKEAITDAITKPSLLSHMILKELFPDETISIDIQSMNSGQVPDEFDISPFFIKYSRNFLPPVYMDIIEHIESEKGVPLVKQWAFEWNKILESEGKNPSAQTLNFFYENEYSDYTVVRDVYLSDIYRSAYLRTISWSIASETISEIDGKFLAIQTSSIDLGLWFLKSNLRPNWWPMHKTSLESTDIPAQVWDLTNTIWKKQQTSMDDWIIAEASGYVYKGNILYDLEINGFFQKNTDEYNYDLELLSNQYHKINEINYDPFGTGLIFQGIIEPRSIDSFKTHFGDIIPASCFIRPLTSPRWQFWRMYRQIWFPNPCISPHLLAFQCSNKAIIVTDFEEIIGKWVDWRDILREKATANLPPLTGQYLQIKRDKINEFMQENDLIFCWICRLIKYERDHSYKQYAYSLDHRMYK